MDIYDVVQLVRTDVFSTVARGIAASAALAIILVVERKASILQCPTHGLMILQPLGRSEWGSNKCGNCMHEKLCKTRIM
ncbi:hypothetical protein NC651_023400 [Populus alba x Populus x berolinensis]|nr:hypothetical protein NC651_023400 [Populus alba x Populus x berolinensis]